MGLFGAYLIVHRPDVPRDGWPEPYQGLDATGEWSYASAGFAVLSLEEMAAALSEACTRLGSPGLAFSLHDSDFAFLAATAPDRRPVRLILDDDTVRRGLPVEHETRWWPTSDPQRELRSWAEACDRRLDDQVLAALTRPLALHEFAEEPLAALLDGLGARRPWEFDHTRPPWPAFDPRGDDAVDELERLIRYLWTRLGAPGAIGKAAIGEPPIPYTDFLRAQVDEAAWEELKGRFTEEEWDAEFGPDVD